MTDTSLLADAVLVLTAAILFYAAFTDLKHFVIRNELIVMVGLLFFAHVALVGRWASVPGHIGLALAIFVLLLLCYAQRWVGGGDVKLLTVAFLWVGFDNAFVFSLLLCVFAVLHALIARFAGAKAGQVEASDVEASEGRTRIAFAPSIAAALIGVFMLGGSIR
jgi:prepilin peptidase CpaA